MSITFYFASNNLTSFDSSIVSDSLLVSNLEPKLQI